MKRMVFLWIGLTMLPAFTACKKDKDTPSGTATQQYQINIQTIFGDSLLHPDSVYTTPEGYQLSFSDLRIYLSAIGSTDQIKVPVLLYDFRNDTGTEINFSGAAGAYSAIRMFGGVNPLDNHGDPAAFENTSPLNLMQANDMHWGWNPGYIFLRIEARVDTIPDAVLNMDHLISYHVGQDDLYTSIDFAAVPWQVNGSKSTVKMQLDLRKLLFEIQPVDLKTEFKTHTAAGEEVLFQKLMSNYTASWRMTP